MSITTIIKCDRCGKQCDNGSMFTVNIIVYKGANSTYIGHCEFSQDHADWCEECCVAMHIHPTPKEQTPTPVPTLEDMVRQIVQEEIDNASGA
jgi:hypothetical protein